MKRGRDDSEEIEIEHKRGATKNVEGEEGEGNEFEGEEGIRRLLIQLKHAREANAEMRSKFPDDPERFFDSELALDDSIRALEAKADSGVSAGICATSDGIGLLQELLLHENEDIVADTVTVINEMSDLSSLEESESELAGRSRFAAAAVKSNVCISRLLNVAVGETTEAATVFAVLSCLDHFCEACPDDLCTKLLAVWRDKNNKAFLQYVAGRIRDVAKKCSTAEDDIGVSSVELIATLSACDNDDMKNIIGESCMEIMLQCASDIRNWNPTCAEDIEFVENLFDIIASLLSTAENKARFDELEGSALLLIILKAKSFAEKGALRALDLALQKNKHGCELFIEFLGLKTLFRIIMKGPCKNSAIKTKADTRDFYENALSCVVSLFQYLSDDERRSRLLSKFSEEDNGKIVRIVALYSQFIQQYSKAQKAFEKVSLSDPDQQLAQQIEAGLSVVQTTAIIIALLCSCSSEFRRRTFVELARCHVDPSDVEQHSKDYIEQLIPESDPQHSALLTLISEARLSSPI